MLYAKQRRCSLCSYIELDKNAKEQVKNPEIKKYTTSNKEIKELLKRVFDAEDKLIEYNSVLKRLMSLRGSSKLKNEAAKSELSKAMVCTLEELRKTEDGPLEYIRESTLDLYGSYRIARILPLYHSDMPAQFYSLKKNSMQLFQYPVEGSYNQLQTAYTDIYTDIPAVEYNKKKCNEIVDDMIKHLKSAYAT